MSHQTKVVLIGWDGADWNHIHPLLDRGLMPNLQSLIETGVMGNIETLNPVLSPMLWNTIATGKYGDEHGILNFSEPNPSGLGVRAYSSLSRKCKAIWNILSQNGMNSNIVNWWASFPAEPINGCIVTNDFIRAPFDEKKKEWRFREGVFHPPDLVDELRHQRLGIHELDESAILPFVPRAGEIDQTKDKRLNSLAKTLAECASIQGAGTWLLSERPANLNAFYFEGIDHFCHGFMHLAAPKLPNVSEELFEIYKDVIDGAYRFHDMMLGAVMRMIDDDTYLMLCSDHGFASGATRPRATPNEPAGPAYWHRALGIFALRGPGIRKDERIYGASLLDITPTLLTLFELPVGRDMSGKVLADAFETPPQIDYIDSWEQVDGDSGMFPPGTEWEEEQSPELIKQFVELGYIEDPGADKALAARKTQTEIDYNLARVYLSRRQPDLARPILEKLLAESPWERRFILHLARCLFECGYLEQTRRLLAKAYPDPEDSSAAVQVLLGSVESNLGNRQQGLEWLENASRKSPALRGVHLGLARVWHSLKDYKKAVECCRRELDRHPECPHSLQIAGAASYKLGEYVQAIDLLLDSAAIRFKNPSTHYYLGAAFSALDQPENAVQAFQHAVTFSPDNTSAHRYLSRLYAQLGDAEQSEMHRQQSILRRAQRRQVNQMRQQRKLETWDIPDLPRPTERDDLLVKNRPRKKPDTVQKERSGKTFVLVSGLPRSGTSLMMQMLQAGGLAPMTDGERKADADNPEGYLEWEAIKKIKKEPELLDDPDAQSKAIKVISMLLPQLPEEHDYLVIFMDRPISEVVSSQFKMIARNSHLPPDANGDDSNANRRRQMGNELNRHRQSVRRWIESAGRFNVLTISYTELIKDPESQINQVVEFLGRERLPNADAMKSAIRADLYRNRNTIADRL